MTIIETISDPIAGPILNPASGAGSELNTNVDASSPNPTAVTTGWSVFNNAVVSAETDAASPTGQALFSNSNTTPTANAASSIDLESYLGGKLITGNRYTVSATAKNDGLGQWRIFFASDNALLMDLTIVETVENTQTSYESFSMTFTYGPNYRYFGQREANGGNDGGVYLADLSFKALGGWVIW